MAPSASTPKGQRTLDSWFSKVSSTPKPSQPKQPSSSSITVNRAPRENTRRNTDLLVIAKDTISVLPYILQQLPHIQASRSERLFLSTLSPLNQAYCPKHKPTPIKIVNQDTLNAAITLAGKVQHGGRVAVLNMASHSSPGGGWLKGAMAQEEALCYRSSLSLSLHKRHYPWRQRMGIYTADVVVIRSDVPSGHTLLDIPPSDLPIISALSIAAPRCPRLNSAGTIYADYETRELMKDKMRLCLRMAAHRGHRLLILGALGCGAFKNPKREVARCWREVFAEAEFEGGWWEKVWFAVYDRRGEGNFETFEEILGGLEV